MSKKGAQPVPAPAKSTPAPAPAKGNPAPSGGSNAKKFDAKSFVKNGVTEEEVVAIKAAFDLFDSDQGGSVDIKGNFQIK